MLFSSAKTDHKAVIAAVDSSVAIIEFSPQGEVLDANANFLNLFGYCLEEITGRSHSLFCEPAYAQSEAERQLWAQLRNGRFASGTFNRRGKGGRAMWTQATYNPVLDAKGRATKVVSIVFDVTASKVRELDFVGKMQAIDRAQAVIEFSPDGVILSANENFLAVIGYSLSEIQGQHHKLFCDPTMTASPEYESFWASLRRGEYVSAEFRRIGKGGREIYLQATYNPVFDDTGSLIKVVKFATDVTESVKRRLRAAELNRNLGAVVARLADAQHKADVALSASTETGVIVQNVAASSEELSHGVQGISTNMTYARGSVQDVSRQTEKASIFAETLNRSAASMTNVVTIIQKIASQINLLSLNATIESARAGEAGKGFAVVAAEVKQLANQTTESTKTIASEIAIMQSVTTEVVEALGLISSLMENMLANVTNVASTVEQQTNATNEIRRNMQSAVTAVEDINSCLSEVTSIFQEVCEASDTVKREMDQLDAA